MTVLCDEGADDTCMVSAFARSLSICIDLLVRCGATYEDDDHSEGTPDTVASERIRAGDDGGAGAGAGGGAGCGSGGSDRDKGGGEDEE